MAILDYTYGFKSQENERSEVRLDITGQLPDWLQGTLIRTSPSKFEVGKDTYKHWFDGLAMLHKFEIRAQQVFYSCKFLASEAYTQAMKKNRIVKGEFGTDPCRDLFQKIATFFKGASSPDNGCVNIIKYGNQLSSCTETPNPKTFELDTLETVGTFTFNDDLSGQLTSVHPHTDEEGNLYSYLTEIGYKSFYHLYVAPAGNRERRLIASIPTQEVAYIHSFGMSQNYLVFIENPMVALPLKFRLMQKPFIENFEWEEERGSIIHLVNKNSAEVRTVKTDAFFCFHHVNAFEQNGEVVFDLVAYEDASIIDHLYLDHLRSDKPSFAAGNLWRFTIPPSGNEVHKKLLSELSVELPRTNYREINTKPYQYLYATASLDPGNFLDGLAKINVNTGEEIIWRQENTYPGEPVFRPKPAAESEDDGVLLSVVLDSLKKNSFLLLLDAKNFKEIARAEVPQHIPFGLHGQFLSSKV